jgi:putative peptidoglycan lipid II flippase
VLDAGASPAAASAPPPTALPHTPAAQAAPALLGGPADLGPATDAEDDAFIKHEVFGEPFTQDDVVEGPVTGSEELDPQVRQRRRLITLGLPILALAVVIGLAWWLGSSVLSVAGSVDDTHGSSPPAITSGPTHTSAPATGGPVAIKSGAVFDPFGDGQPENDNKVPLSFDGNPTTAWDTLIYKRAAFGNLKPGVGVVYDLGSPQTLSGATITTTMPGATMEIRVGDQPKGSLDNFRVVGSETVEGTTDIHFAKPVTTRYVLVWVTNLGQTDKGFQADVAELALHSAG